MSYAESIKQKLAKGSKESLKAVIYARVSTDSEGQKESCANQVALAQAYAEEHPNLDIISIYIDDGISGKNDFTRPQYNQMLQLLSNGGFDLIITKSLSRLNRDELNSLLLKSMLVEHDATIFTLEDGQVHDFEDMNSDLLHSIKYAMDAQYVKQQSVNGRKTQQLRCERKELTAKDISFGYDWNKDTKTITINEEQADIVRQIFEDYVYRNGTPASIRRWLKEKGIVTSEVRIAHIIRDERYIGKFYINKRTSKLGTGKVKSKRIALPKEQWVLCERPDLRILDDDLFELAQRIHSTRITVYKKPDKGVTEGKFHGTHLYSGKIFCPLCGKAYFFGFSDRAKEKPLYSIHKHSDCSNPVRRIYEDDLVKITTQALKSLVNAQDDVCSSVEQTLKKRIMTTKADARETERLKRLKASKEKQLDNFLDQLGTGEFNVQAQKKINARINVLTEEIDDLEKQIRDREESVLDEKYVLKRVNSISAAITELSEFTFFDRGRVLDYIERINMPPNGDVELILKSGQTISARYSIKGSESLGKHQIQDVSDLESSNSEKGLFLTSFDYLKSTPTRMDPNKVTLVTVYCYLLQDG